MTAMHPITFAALEAFPRELEKHYGAFPARFVHWAPASWEGVPSEQFTAIEQVCHVRDIEIEGYQVRFRRTLEEASPFLPSIDSETIAKLEGEGRYATIARDDSDLRRRAWEGRELPPDQDAPTLWPSPDADADLEQGRLHATLESAIKRLGAHERHVLVALAVNGVPIDVLAERLGTTRAAVYDTLHDARRLLRRHVAASA